MILLDAVHVLLDMLRVFWYELLAFLVFGCFDCAFWFGVPSLSTCLLILSFWWLIARRRFNERYQWISIWQLHCWVKYNFPSVTHLGSLSWARKNSICLTNRFMFMNFSNSVSYSENARFWQAINRIQFTRCVPVNFHLNISNFRPGILALLPAWKE